MCITPDHLVIMAVAIAAGLQPITEDHRKGRLLRWIGGGGQPQCRYGYGRYSCSPPAVRRLPLPAQQERLYRQPGATWCALRLQSGKQVRMFHRCMARQGCKGAGVH
jgi:hypothetical protein